MSEGKKKPVLRFLLENGLAIIALFIAAPPFVDWVWNKLTRPGLEVRPPPLIDLRGYPVSDARGGIDQDRSLASQVALIMPMSYFNYGDSGDRIWVDREVVTLFGPDGSVLVRMRGYYDTEMLEGASSWYGSISPWLPRVVLGGEYRSNEVVFIPVDDESPDFQDLVTVLEQAEASAELLLTVEIETLVAGPFQAECRVSIGDLAPSPTSSPERAGFYRRQAECRPTN